MFQSNFQYMYIAWMVIIYADVWLIFFKNQIFSALTVKLFAVKSPNPF